MKKLKSYKYKEKQMTKIYAKGLTKKEYYREWEEEHRERRNAYRRKKYREKCEKQHLKLLDKDKKDTI